MSKYIAIIGDLVDSKKIKNRRSFQEELKENLEKINKSYKDSIASRITLTVGDEFQGLLKLDGNLMKILDELYVAINWDFRMGIGYGDIITGINPKISIGADGEAYWRAREAILYVHGNNYAKKCNIYFLGSNENLNSTINTLFLLTELIKFQWTDLQRETFSLMVKEGIYSGDFNQQEFSKTIGITESSLSKRLSLSNIKIYLEGRNELMKIMENNYEKL